MVRGFLEWLASMGALAAGEHEARPVVGGCETGDYVLGLRDDLPLHSHAETRVVVLPDFEVVFMTPSPAAEAALARFCDRTGAGRVGALLKITKASILRAGVAGLALADFVAAFETHTEGLPSNVLHEVQTWFSRTRRVRAASGIVIECPDVPTADRIEAVARPALERLGKQVLLARDRRAFDRVARKLAAEGIVFDLDLAGDPTPRKKAARRRRSRRWR
jgi:hypothetical protein